MKKKSYIRSIFDRFVKGSNSSEELDDLFRYFGEGPEQEVREIISEELEKPVDNSAITASEQEALNRIDRQVYDHVRDNPHPAERPTVPLLKRKLIYRRAVAAAVILMGIWGAYSLYTIAFVETEPHQIAQASYDQEPGGNRATLTLADGRTVILSKEEDAIIVNADEVTYGGGHTVAGLDGHKGERLNILQTPRGGQYRIILPDGTKVWLNAASSLRYPSRFVGSERRVELDGEGYFEVVHNGKQKFKVVSNGQEVEVLGTRFNVNAYSDEPHIRTTLIEGAVSVASLSGKQAVQLVPGQQSKFGKDILEVDEVDIEAVVAWKDNDFMFRGQNLNTIMRQLARWYDVEIRYAPDAPIHLKLGGSVSRDNRLSSVLKAMASTNSVRFDFDGKTIWVKSTN
ncbi:DUF4974 domain-containing protein [Sphingobacterium sp. SGG-5]|uniref:FecR family protein n=1 Tax=Sphingobacterium sp. SGG-5 TaxID=2710881 RepID=UPI0013EA2106|nr:FecR domain-containing protein [Sphingobacterium sp. SGG-5]NGM62652.1 DUF4974 domain-containing protein [Sphingobacterium sp. SGG-5]